MSDFFAGMWPVLAIMFCYIALSISVQLAAQPARRRLVRLAEDLGADKRATDADRKKLNDFLDLSMSWKVAILAPVGIMGGIADAILNKNEKPSRHWLDSDPRTHSFALNFAVSIFAANLPMAIISIPLLMIGFVVFLWAQKSTNEVLERPALRAAGRLRPTI